MKKTIDDIFNRVSYWQDKTLLLRAIGANYFTNKNIMIRLLGISSGLVSYDNEAKRDMWNHQLHRYNMGDDILSKIAPEILDDMDFAQNAIVKYNRTYIYLSQRLQASRDLALVTASKETNTYPHNEPILKYMPEIFQNDQEIATIATTRNIENLKYAPILQNNKYFILDVINLIYEDSIKYKVLEYMNQEFLHDKRFVSKLGCFDGLCEQFRGDEIFVSYTIMDDIDILDKVEMFSEKILESALKNKDYHTNHSYVLRKIFRYIESFNDDFNELNSKIKNKELLHKLFWELAQLSVDEF
jgi:hypothetical protein